MECLKCKAELQEGALICPNCNDNVAESRQRAKCESYTKNTRSLLNESFHSTPYLIAMICLSVVAVIFLLNAIVSIGDGGYLVAVVAVIVVILAIISAVQGWKAYKSKADITPESIRKMALFVKTLRVFGVILSILTTILVAIIVAVVTVLADMLDSMGDFLGELGSLAGEDGAGLSELGSLLSGGSTGLVIFIVIFAVLIVAFVINLTKTYTNAKKYYEVLSKTASTYVYDTTQKAPIIRMYIFGGLAVLLGFVSFLASWKLGLMFVGIGGFTVTTGLWFNKVHQGQIDNHNEYLCEQEVLDKIIKDTTAERQRIAQINAQDGQKQQQLMQQMMQQMMVQNMQNASKKGAPTDKTDK